MKLSVFSIAWLITHLSYLFCSICFFDYLAFMNLLSVILSHSHAGARKKTKSSFSTRLKPHETRLNV
jgi:hypothetical protein